MTKREDSHLEMADVRQSDGISVIFDRDSPASSRSRSPSRSSRDSRRSISSGRSNRSTGSGRYRGRSSRRGRYRSSSSSRSRSTSRTRSRSHPRCYRPSSRCRCANHPRYGRGSRSPPRHYRAHSRSYSRSPSPDRRRYYSRRNRSRSRSSSRLSRHRRAVSRYSQSPRRSHKSRSRSGSSGQSVNLSLDDKCECLRSAQTDAMTIVGVEELELPESVKPILPERSEESRQFSPDTWVRQEPEKSPSQSSSNEEPDELFSPKMPPKRKIISFSINNSVVKPVVSSPSSVKVTSRVDSYESRKPYGHWVRVKARQNSNARKRTLAASH